MQLLILILVVFGAVSCGKRKPPLPPVERVIQQVEITATQLGNKVNLVWQMPARNASDGSILNISRVDVYRLTESLNQPLTLTEEDFISRSTVIASLPIEDSDFGLKQKTYVDTLQFAGQEARIVYAVRFVNASGQKAAFSNFYLLEPIARIAKNPETLKANITQSSINLNWISPKTNVDGSEPPNILGYNVYRSGKDSPKPKRLNERPIPETRFADEFFQFETHYAYFVRTVSLGKNGLPVESVSSNTITVLPKDTFAPSPPSAITVAAAPNTISIFFATNVEKDVVGYKVFRTTDSNQPKSNWNLLTKDILKETTFQDKRVEAGKTYYYYLIAVDKFGNESEPSEVVSEKAF